MQHHATGRPVKQSKIRSETKQSETNKQTKGERQSVVKHSEAQAGSGTPEVFFYNEGEV